MTDVRTAVVLAAGRGTRLRSVWSDGPKGLLEVGGETLIARSVRLLEASGIERVVVVAGYRADAYRAFAASHSGVEVALNEAYAETESMASLARALERVDEDFLLLESDLFYEPRALTALLDCGSPDAVLASGPTGATDEVWIGAPDQCVRQLSKDRDELEEVHGEFVGILRISQTLGRLLGSAYARFLATHGHGRMAYETDALVEVAAKHPVALCLVPDLLWGEVDDETHYQRVTTQLLPAVRAAGEKGESGA